MESDVLTVHRAGLTPIQVQQTVDLARSLTAISGLPTAIEVTCTLLEQLLKDADPSVAAATIERIHGKLESVLKSTATVH